MLGIIGSVIGSVIGSIISAAAKLVQFFTIRKDEVDLGQKRQEAADLREKEAQQDRNIDLIDKANKAAKEATNADVDSDPNNLDRPR